MERETILSLILGMLTIFLILFASYHLYIKKDGIFHDLMFDNEECWCYQKVADYTFNLTYFGFNGLHNWKEQYNVSTCHELCLKING